MQSSQEFVQKYVLEIIIRKSADKILGMELINRNEIYCLETTSWKVSSRQQLQQTKQKRTFTAFVVFVALTTLNQIFDFNYIYFSRTY